MRDRRCQWLGWQCSDLAIGVTLVAATTHIPNYRNPPVVAKPPPANALRIRNRPEGK